MKVLKRCTRVEPEPQTQHPDTRVVFGVSLQRLRDAGGLQRGVPLVLKNMVEFLEKYGEVFFSSVECKELKLSVVLAHALTV